MAEGRPNDRRGTDRRRRGDGPVPPADAPGTPADAPDAPSGHRAGASSRRSATVGVYLRPTDADRPARIAWLAAVAALVVAAFSGLWYFAAG